jgi:DNA-binding response OmpR family regulator
MTKIYLAEDDETMVTLLVTLLTIEGFEVEKIDLAKGELMETLREEPPNILLLDVNLPGESGLEVVRKMRQEEIFNKTRVVMASGMSLEKECLSSGADDFLMKPYMPDDLIQILRKYT